MGENMMLLRPARILIALVSVAVATGLAAAEGERFEVAAYYFPGYHPEPRNDERFGPGWTEWELVKAARPRFAGHRQPRVPAWGYRDESDPDAFEQKIDAAADHGITTLIFDWYWYGDAPFLQGALDKGFLKAENRHRLKFALMWANHDWIDIFPYKRGTPRTVIHPGKVSPSVFRNATDYVIRRCFTDPGYWKIQGKPYFSIYHLGTLLDSFGSIQATRAALDDFRRRTQAAGLAGLHLGAVAWGQPRDPQTGKPIPLGQLVDELGFDSVTSYVWVHHVRLPEMRTDYRWARKAYFEYWDRARRAFAAAYFPNVTVGWDSSPRADQADEYGPFGYPFTNTIVGNSPEQFAQTLRAVRQRLEEKPTGPRVVTINSWNEWTEGSYLEPDTTYGTKYLEAVRDVFPPPGSSRRRRRNVLFIISDDLNCRIGCYGDRLARTPHIDRLASWGVRFERAYCQFPLCNPTRCSVLTGLYPTTTGVLDNNTLLLLDGRAETIQDCFRRHGYAVAEHGKIWHGRNRGIRPGESKPKGEWYTPEERARQQAEEPDYWQRHHSPYRHRTVADPERYAWANVYGPLKPGDRGRDAPVADRAIKSLRSFGAAKQPFFLAVGFRLPHVPLTAPREFFALHKVAKMPLPPDFANEPTLAPDMPRDEWRVNLDLFAARRFSEVEAREAIRAYYACVSYMDAQLGRVLDELERLGLRNNTIIVFWGDHGWHLSEKGMWAKGTTFEVSARGPLIIVDPRRGATAGRASRRVVQYLDIYPTLVDLCGLDGPKTLEGHSLRRLIENPDAPWDDPALTVQTRGWFIGRSVRTDRWRYTQWDEGRRGAMLFDHQNDPHEMHNLAADPRYADVIQRLDALLARCR
ncbi:MAG TPA: hypothetical protein EYH34_10755 [Planctomycetes bacterium]|nr:hypothetical protein [Planctomycetota bacterium]